MLTSLIIALVQISRRFAALIALAALLASIGLGVYVVKNIKINTDVDQLLAADLGWRQREKALAADFPDKVDNLVVVIDGPDAARVDAAAAALAARLQAEPDLFTYVARPDALPYFRTNGLLLMPKNELADTLDRITQAQPLLGVLTTDPTLRGFFGLIGLMAQGVQVGQTDAAQLARPLAAIDATVNAALAGKDMPLDWAQMVPPPKDSAIPDGTRAYIITKPVLDFSSLQPGEKATNALRQAVTDLGLAAQGVRVRLTGSVALNDQQFASVTEGAGFATILSGVLVLLLLFLAMRTWRIIVPIALTLVAGLIASTAFAVFAVGSLNLISVAFAVMFIGIAVDFGIQFGVRYRDQHYLEADHAKAMTHTARIIAVPLAMAAASTALGFLSFIPTQYRGVSELGLIAGSGMVIAFFLNVTLLPALMTLLPAPPERETIGFQALAPLNAFLQNRRKILLPLIAVLALAGLAAASRVQFDFDPLDLDDPHAESVSTMFDLMKEPNSDAYAAQLLAPTLDAAQTMAARLEKLPQVDSVMDLASFVPDDQAAKIKMIADTQSLLAPTLALPAQPAPDDAQTCDALTKAASALRAIGNKVASANALADSLDKLAKASPDARTRAQKDIIVPLQKKFGEIRGLLNPHPVSMADIPDALKKDWVTPDGQYLVEALPKRGPDGNPRDPKMLKHFIGAIRAIYPDVAGTPVSIIESGRTVVSAFIHAGIYGVVSIGLLALITLRRVRDVLLMLTPLLIAGDLTLATITVIGLPLNFANIIALPLLLSLGVSYAVYFVSYWRNGGRDLLQSSMARAVLFSAGTVLVAFMSLCFSAHPGTRSMGELLTIALLYSLLCTFFMLPVFLSSDKKRR
ncbi:MAG: MMPL family transporter [Alphaproteobacteria bacterium]|nr:MMPL family transporter [Alphaproteobacteria bacterium]